MKSRKVENGWLLVLASGENVHKSVTEFCNAHKINAASISGIGAFQSAEIAWYNLKEKKYSTKTLRGDMEVLNLSGNIALADNKPILHAHVTLSDSSFAAFGGHVVEGIVGASLEVFIITHVGPFHRKYDECAGLKLIDI